MLDELLNIRDSHLSNRTRLNSKMEPEDTSPNDSLFDEYPQDEDYLGEE